MSLEPGQSLAHYRLVEKIGEGGMGEVWKATDTGLNRDVAIKILPAAFAQYHERLSRFEREARALAALNHPAIAHVYGLHEQDGVHFLAMELVPGEDLMVRLQRGPLPLDDAVQVAHDIACALETAHDNGIVHRDLKPANVVLGHDGKAKVLDFGLAKVVEPEAGQSSDASLSPTLTSAGTVAGVILGTAAYMSPEQARGKPVDRRADIWAFGCVLYEMLSGQRLFSGETVSDTLAAVLRADLDLGGLPAGTSGPVCRLVERCLTRDPLRRLRDIGEARIVLEDAVAGNDAGEQAEEAVGPAARRVGPVLLGAAAVLAAACFAAGWWLRPAEPVDGAGFHSEASIRRLTFGEGLEFAPTLSPDGNYMAYTTDASGGLDIAVLPLDGGDVRQVVEHPADDAHPAWSPDGTRLAFTSARDHAGGLLRTLGGVGVASTYITGSGGDIFLAPALGGPATKVADDGAHPAWSPDGRRLVFHSNRDEYTHLWTVPADGGEPTRLTEGDTIDYQPAWSPDGRFVAFGCNTPGAGGGLELIPADGGERVRLFEGLVLAPAWSPDGGWLYFSTDRNAAPATFSLWRIRVGEDGSALSEPERVTFGVGSDTDTSFSAEGGPMVYGSVRFTTDIWSVVPGEPAVRITSADSHEDYPHLNPDGRRLVFESDRGRDRRIWSMDLQTGAMQLIQTGGLPTFPRWSPDGKRLAYSLATEDASRLVIQTWGDLTPEVVAEDTDYAGTAPQWSPDGKRLAAYGSRGISVHDPGGPSRNFGEDYSSFPTWSPDGREIAYQIERRAGDRQIWARPVDGGEPRRLSVGDEEYSHPQWSPTDPEEILVVVDHQDLGILRVSTGQVERITDLASSTVLVDYPSWTADGRRAFFSLARKTGDVFLVELP